MANEQNPPQPPKDPQSERRGPVPPPFTVEFGDDFLRNHTIHTPPFKMIVRGAFDLSRLGRRERDGKRYGAREVGTAAQRIPQLPGAYLEINCRTKKVRLYDPLDSKEGKDLLDMYNGIARSETGHGLPRDLGPFKPIEHTLDDHQLKTLVLEIARKLESKCCRVVSGDFPTPSAIEAMPGDELYDPANNSYDKPVFKKNYQQYREKLAASGI